LYFILLLFCAANRHNKVMKLCKLHPDGITDAHTDV